MAKLPSLQEVKDFIKLLKIDVFLFLCTFAFFLPSVTLNQLIQDKYCLNKYNLTEEICLTLVEPGPEFETLTNQILDDSTSLKNLQTIITTVPGIVVCLFLGYWIDSYPGQLRYLLAVFPFTGMVNMSILIYQSFNYNIRPYSILYGNILPAMTGGLMIFMAGIYKYIVGTTAAKSRSFRFASLQLISFFSLPMATAIGGKLLAMKPWFPDQHRNYIGVFLTALIVSFIACIWVLYFLNDSETVDPSKTPEEASSSDKMDNVDLSDDDSGRGSGKEEGNSVPSEPTEVKKRGIDKTSKDIFLDIIKPRNVVNLMKTCCKKRDNQGRARLMHLILIMTIVIICYEGEADISFQFCQKGYHWNGECKSDFVVTLSLLPFLGSRILPALSIYKFHWHDTTLGLIGCLTLMASIIIKGGLLIPLGLSISNSLGVFSELLSLAIQSLISKIISFNEIGQIFALLSCIESYGLMVSAFFTSVFNSTIDISPWIVFLADALLSLYPLSVILWIHRTRFNWDSTLERKCEKELDQESRIIPEAKENFKSVSYSSEKRESVNDDEEIQVRIEVNCNVDQGIGPHKSDSSEIELTHTQLTKS